MPDTTTPAQYDILPRCDDSEEYLLSAMLSNPKVIDTAADRLTSQDFYLSDYQKLFAEMVTTRSIGGAVDVATMSASLPALRDLIVTLSGAPYVASYASDYCRTIRDTSLRRQTMQVGSRIREVASEDLDIESILDTAEQMVLDLRTTRQGGDGANVHDLIHDAAARVDRAMHGVATYQTRTHLKTVNELVGGLEAGQLIILAAYTGQGKTSFALNIAQHMAETQSVAYYSLEMGRAELVDRLMSTIAKVPGPKVKSGNITPDEFADLMTALGEVDRLKLHIDDSAGLSVLDLQRKARRIKSRQGLDILIVDYIQLMTSHVKESRQQEVATITRNLKQMARELEVPVIALSQFSRAQKVAGKDGTLLKRKPDLSDLRDSGAIEQDADMVWFLYHKTQDSDVDFIVAKNRGGPTGERQLDFYPQYTEFRDKR
jgi:replicative DNA helicase